MRAEQVRLLVFVAATSVAAVGFVLMTAVLSIFVVFALKSLFAVIVNAIAFIAELIVAVVAAITSGSASHACTFHRPLYCSRVVQSVYSVCVSVCLNVRTITFERNDL